MLSREFGCPSFFFLQYLIWFGFILSFLLTTLVSWVPFGSVFSSAKHVTGVWLFGFDELTNSKPKLK